MNTDGEAVIMLAFQASGRGSTPLQCIFSFSTILFLSALLVHNIYLGLVQVFMWQDMKTFWKEKPQFAILSLQMDQNERSVDKRT